MQFCFLRDFALIINAILIENNESILNTNELISSTTLIIVCNARKDLNNANKLERCS